MNMQKNGFAVLMEMLQFEGCRLARKHNISISEFKVTYGWVRRFMARHDLTIRCRTTIERDYWNQTRESWSVSINMS
jgi:hypothetical protein